MKHYPTIFYATISEERMIVDYSILEIRGLGPKSIAHEVTFSLLSLNVDPSGPNKW